MKAYCHGVPVGWQVSSDAYERFRQLYSKRDRLRDFSGGLFLSDFTRIYKGIGLLLY